MIRTPENILMIHLKSDHLPPSQEAYIKQLIDDYTKKTETSLRFARNKHKSDAFWLNSILYRDTLKSLCYTLGVSRAEGSYFWDMDGNRYLDIAMGYGVFFFGYNAEFISQAIAPTLRSGFTLGPETDDVLFVANTLCAITGSDRVALTNTGCEAVMDAIRMARAATGKKKLVTFDYSYHGRYGGVYGFRDSQGETQPFSQGMTTAEVQDLIVLPYGRESSLEIIHQHKDDLAAILLEPIQNYYPEHRPIEFVKSCRQLCDEADAALIFDEIYSGFRSHIRGAQAYYQVIPDISLYGKLLGGGFPIGAVAGQSRFLDTMDGGAWSIGSTLPHPERAVFCAGTFSKHPVTMAATRAVLTRLLSDSPALQNAAKQKCEFLKNELNVFFANHSVPLVIRSFGSTFRFDLSSTTGDTYDLDLQAFFYSLILHGVYTWPIRTCSLSTAHSWQDINFLIDVVKYTTHKMLLNGFFK